MRNRELTEARLIEAGFETLEIGGLTGFGVNAVARQAKCDKKLIYRYFDGPEGLLAAMGRAEGDELSRSLSAVLDPRPESYGALIRRLALALAAHLRASHRARQAALMALAAPTEAARPFREARGAAIAAWFAVAKGELTAPPELDAPALNAALILAVEGLALAAPAGHAGLALGTDAEWHRAERAIVRLVEAVYGIPAASTARPEGA